MLAALLGTGGRVYADEVPMIACHEPAPQTKITVTFKPNVSLHDLVAWAGGFTCKNIVFSADVERAAQGMTIIAPKPLTPKQAMQLFVDSLDTIGLVVNTKGDTITIKLGSKAIPRCSVATTESVPSVDPFNQAPVTSDTSDADASAIIAKGIGEIDETHYTISAALIDFIVANPMSVAKGARVVPRTENGKALGFKLYAIRPASLFAKLGLLNGDGLLSVNGIVLTSADVALEAYTKLATAKQVEIVIERRGAKKTLYYTIQR
ncbi:MAG TPA: type II secretion system protein GspC [Kofleriaceae bacterium]